MLPHWAPLMGTTSPSKVLQYLIQSMMQLSDHPSQEMHPTSLRWASHLSSSRAAFMFLPLCPSVTMKDCGPVSSVSCSSKAGNTVASSVPRPCLEHGRCNIHMYCLPWTHVLCHCTSLVRNWTPTVNPWLLPCRNPGSHAESQDENVLAVSWHSSVLLRGRIRKTEKWMAAYRWRGIISWSRRPSIWPTNSKLRTTQSFLNWCRTKDQ